MSIKFQMLFFIFLLTELETGQNGQNNQQCLQTLNIAKKNTLMFNTIDLLMFYMYFRICSKMNEPSYGWISLMFFTTLCIFYFLLWIDVGPLYVIPEVWFH